MQCSPYEQAGVPERPFVLAQLSDSHIGADWAGGDPLAGLAEVVKAMCAMQQPLDAVLVSGDLSDNGIDSEYEQVRELLAPLRAPIYVLAGNHDDRGRLRRHFDLPGVGDEPVQYSVDLGPLRLVVLDTTRPGENEGSLDRERLDWLEAELHSASDQLTLLATHHPPLATGMRAWDAICLPAADLRALAAVIDRHSQVRAIVGGHVHRTITGDLVGRTVLTVPSTYVQARLNLSSGIEFAADEPSGFALHMPLDGKLISHLQPVRR